jgi:hypothetical protein
MLFQFLLNDDPMIRDTVPVRVMFPELVTRHPRLYQIDSLKFFDKRFELACPTPFVDKASVGVP